MNDLEAYSRSSELPLFGYGDSSTKLSLVVGRGRSWPLAGYLAHPIYFVSYYIDLLCVIFEVCIQAWPTEDSSHC